MPEPLKTPRTQFTASPLLQPFVDNGTLAGAVALAATKDQVICLDTVGFADIAAGRPMTADTIFWIASQTKPMTATALMMLVDEGGVNVGDPVEKYLPEFKGQMLLAEKDDDHALLRKPCHPITVREILSHTSGLPFQSPVETPTFDMLPLRTAVLSYAAGPLAFEPGSRYEYSNAGTNTAGRIVEVVSGMAYEEFMRARLFGPLDMSNTTFVPDEKQAALLAKAYKPGPGNAGLVETAISQLSYPLTNPLRQPIPAGGLFSNARDVLRFCRMIMNGGELDGRRYLSESAVKQMTTKQTGDRVENQYGFGWDTSNATFGHGGAFSTNMRIDPQRGLVTVFLVQHAGFPGDGGKCPEAFKQSLAEWFDAQA